LKLGSKVLIICLIFISSPFWISFLLPKSKVKSEFYGDKQKHVYFQIHTACSTTLAGSFVFYKIPSNEQLSSLHGQLSRLDCSDANQTNRIEYKFMSDSSGEQNCYGKMTKIKSPQKIITVWKFEGANSGNHCSLVGKSLKFEIERTGSLPEGK
jgi:hypothetical protein